MPTNVEKVFEEALTLAVNERAELAAHLLASLDENAAAVRKVWAAEITRRAADAREQVDDDQDWRSVLNDIEREVLSR